MKNLIKYLLVLVILVKTDLAVGRKLVAGKGHLHSDEHEFHNTVEGYVNATTSDGIDKWTAPAKIREWFPYELTGYDDEGSAVYINHYGKWRYADLFRYGGEEGLMLFEKYYAQLLHRLTESAKINDGCVLIFDFDGFSLENFAHPEALRLSLKQFSTLEKIAQSTKYGFGINVNFAAQLFINTAKPFLGTFLEKFEVFGTRRERWIPQLLRRIPMSSLPKQYGGIL